MLDWNYRKIRKMLKALRQSKSGILIDLEVVPNSKKELMEYDEWTNRIKIKEPAVKGKANAGIIKKFSGLFGSCKIVSGSLSRKKTVLILGSNIESVNGILSSELKN
jgi:uncharacterized protein (TIGR00251 family)